MMVLAAILAAILLAVFTGLVFWTRRHWLVVKVQGSSMIPAFRDGDVVITRKCAGGAVAVGDVVVFESPGLTHNGTSVLDLGGVLPKWIIKRVAAVPGDAVPAELLAVVPIKVVPAGALIVLSDNNGFDSRTFGLLRFDRVLGVVVRPLTARH